MHKDPLLMEVAFYVTKTQIKYFKLIKINKLYAKQYSIVIDDLLLLDARHLTKRNWEKKRIRIAITGFGTRTSFVSGANFRIKKY